MPLRRWRYKLLQPKAVAEGAPCIMLLPFPLNALEGQRACLWRELHLNRLLELVDSELTRAISMAKKAKNRT
ncbi:hypothetical protein N7489_011887 [Penicillium chrysogenum]|uniref:uncharacterized protein n=1 Tax=Penicillium chrysogenum TaxID=5076 RepID=UPI0024DF19AB|nr:uncharacterized protein N7489_011887 [Penicillium chrysogenum]KAJ5231179.1 hypothetical protein N7489_011887 [Penicillium chrysogenum]